MVPWAASRAGEEWLGDGVLGAQVVVEGDPIWAVEAIVQVIGPRAVLIAGPEVDPGLLEDMTHSGPMIGGDKRRARSSGHKATDPLREKRRCFTFFI